MAASAYNISILGCGWLGLPLAEHLIRQGHSVKGATTRPEKLDTLQEKNIEPYLIRLNPQINKDYDSSFFESDILVINIPPGRNRDDVANFHLAQIQSLISALQNSGIQKILFVSSTSVYADLGREVREAAPALCARYVRPQTARPGCARHNRGDSL